MPKARTVTLLMDGEKVAKVWPIEPDAEIKIMGWWGRLEQLKVGNRVWVWLKLNRQQQPVAVCMIADEPSEQDIHGNTLEVSGVEGGRVTFKTKKQPDRTLGWTMGEPLPKVGDKLFVQSAGTQVRWAAPESGFAEKRAAQQADLRKRWESEGLPGTISVQHTFSGELEVLIDHEGDALGAVAGSRRHGAHSGRAADQGRGQERGPVARTNAAPARRRRTRRGGPETGRPRLREE